jgi:hypothetical protein
VNKIFIKPSNLQIEWVEVAMQSHKKMTPSLILEKWDELAECELGIPPKPTFAKLMIILDCLVMANRVFCYGNQIATPLHERTYGSTEILLVKYGSNAITE